MKQKHEWLLVNDDKYSHSVGSVDTQHHYIISIRDMNAVDLSLGDDDYPIKNSVNNGIISGAKSHTHEPLYTLYFESEEMMNNFVLSYL